MKTVLSLALGLLAAWSPALYPKLRYDALKDFAPIMQATSLPLLVASSGKLNYASTGNGTAVHLAGEVLKSTAGLDALHVPYKGGPDAMTALMTGAAAFTVINLELALPQVRGGKLRALAVTGSRHTQGGDGPFCSATQRLGCRHWLTSSRPLCVPSVRAGPRW